MHAIGADPHFHVLRTAVVDAVGDDPVDGGRGAGRERRLHRTGHGRKSRVEGNAVTDSRQRLQGRHARQIFLTKSGNREQQDVDRRRRGIH